MPKFVTVGYGDEASYNRTSPEVRDAAHAHDADLVKSGALVGRAGLPVLVRNPEAKGVQTENVAFMSSPIPIAGFAVTKRLILRKRSRWFPIPLVPLHTVSLRCGRY